MERVWQGAGVKDKIAEYIDSLKETAVELETELCRYPAVSPDSGGEGELDKCVFLEGWLKAHGITALERHDAPDSRSKGGVRPNLIATVGDAGDDGASSRFWIMSHTDVVPPGEASLWKTDPWKLVRDGSRVIGRGVEDNQQGLVSSVLAAMALNKLGITPARTVKLLFAADEECGSNYGIGWLIKNRPGLFRKNDTALIPDGGDPDGASIEVAEKNLVWARFSVSGAQSHGSRPDLGVNAHLAGAGLVVRLHDGLTKKFNRHDPLFEPPYSTFEPTKKEANVPNFNTIPGEDVFCYDMRILPCYPIDTVLAEIDRIKAGTEAKYKVAVTYTLAQRMESRPTPVDAPLVRLLAKNISEIYGIKTKPVGIGGGTVGAYLRNIGIDSAVWCRIDDSAHQPNEYAFLDNILGDAKVMALMMLAE
jgi:succinyl-diaminopimelate desuccinylase